MSRRDDLVRYDPNCPECKGSGQRDSGGVYPWGEGIFLACDCDALIAQEDAAQDGGNQ